MDKYSTGVRWLHDVLYNISFTADRVGVVANKIINDVARFNDLLIYYLLKIMF